LLIVLKHGNNDTHYRHTRATKAMKAGCIAKATHKKNVATEVGNTAWYSQTLCSSSACCNAPTTDKCGAQETQAGTNR
jgi:hypothetical protein